MICYENLGYNNFKIEMLRKNSMNASVAEQIFSIENFSDMGVNTYKVAGWKINYKWINNVSYSYCIKIEFTEGITTQHIYGIRIAYE